MIRMFARHGVEDFAKWKAVYDSFGSVQEEGGVVDAAVYRAADNPNDLTITHDFNTLEEAQAFANSPELKAGMQEAGVYGPPDIWFATQV